MSDMSAFVGRHQCSFIFNAGRRVFCSFLSFITCHTRALAHIIWWGLTKSFLGMGNLEGEIPFDILDASWMPSLGQWVFFFIFCSPLAKKEARSPSNLTPPKIPGIFSQIFTTRWLAVCMVTTVWVAIHSWIAWFLVVWRAKLQLSTCWVLIWRTDGWCFEGWRKGGFAMQDSFLEGFKV